MHRTALAVVLALAGPAVANSPAELNGWPGPLHVPEHAEALGARQVAAERRLDAAFRDRALQPAAVDALNAEIGTSQGALRSSHLRTRLAQTAPPTAPQVAEYARLRGYAGSGGEGHGHAGHGQPQR